MPSLGGWEIVIIVFLIFLLFGAKKIPDMMKSLGSGIKEFKKSVNPDDEKKEEGIVKKD
jgi:sec-independent protein translocase protein TatA